MASASDKKIRSAFIEEVNELLDSLNAQLLHLENAPEDKDVINEIFRLTHSIKSEAALVGFLNISELSHKMEDIFDRIRTNNLIVNQDVMNTLFKSYDKIIKLINLVQGDEDESGIDITEELSLLDNILNIKVKPQKKEIKKIKTSEEKSAGIEVKKGLITEVKTAFTEYETNQIEEGLEKGESFYKIIYYLSKECDMRYPRAYLVFNNFESSGTVIRSEPNITLESEDEKFKAVALFFLSKANLNVMVKCADVDQIDRIDIYKFDIKALSRAGINISNVPDALDQIIVKEEIASAEKIEQEWAKEIESTLSNEKKKSKSAKGDMGKEDKPVEREQKPKSAETGIKRQTIRVDTDRLDNLMNLVGELIINHSRFVQLRNIVSDRMNIQDLRSELEDAANQYERVLDQMESGLMLVRMIPIGTIFSRFPRMVRDLSNSLHKNVNLEISGESTEIDKAIIELITEPLTHIIRNAIDHGIEKPEDRISKGKPRSGTIELRSYQQGSNIYIEVSDDGQGINVEKIKAEAINRGLIDQFAASNMTEEQAYNILFEPGFSTKKEVTGISGRGVGMDVVRNQVEKLRGDIEITSQVGKGTTIKIALPLTLTIVEAVLVNIGQNLFAIPVNDIEETLIIKKEFIKDFDEYKVFDLRNETVAILNLSELVGFKSKKVAEDYFVVIVKYEKKRVGLIVDDLIGHQDIVIKALDESIKDIIGVAGATVLGDGKIALIVDVNSLVRDRKRELNKLAESLNSVKQGKASFDKIYDELNKEGEKDKILSKKESLDDMPLSGKVSKE